MTAWVMDSVVGHPLLASLSWLIVFGFVGMFVVIKHPFTKPVPRDEINDEGPWKDSREEQ